MQCVDLTISVWVLTSLYNRPCIMTCELWLLRGEVCWWWLNDWTLVIVVDCSAWQLLLFRAVTHSVASFILISLESEGVSFQLVNWNVYMRLFESSIYYWITFLNIIRMFIVDQVSTFLDNTYSGLGVWLWQRVSLLLYSVIVFKWEFLLG